MVTDQFPIAELDFIGASNGGQFDPKSGLITWNLGRIANSNQQVVNLTVTASVKAAVPAVQTSQIPSPRWTRPHPHPIRLPKQCGVG